jgi:hypothetical protein
VVWAEDRFNVFDLIIVAFGWIEIGVADAGSWLRCDLRLWSC